VGRDLTREHQGMVIATEGPPGLPDQDFHLVFHTVESESCTPPGRERAVSPPVTCSIADRFPLCKTGFVVPKTQLTRTPEGTQPRFTVHHASGNFLLVQRRPRGPVPV
jgi:hypothetical protein